MCTYTHVHMRGYLVASSECKERERVIQWVDEAEREPKAGGTSNRNRMG